MPGGYDWGGWNALVALNTILANQRGDTKTARALTAGQLASDVVGMQNSSSGNELSKAGDFASSHAPAIGAVIGSMVPGLGTTLGSAAGAAVGQASTGDRNIQNIATVAAMAGLGSAAGGNIGNIMGIASGYPLAIGGAGGAEYGVSLISQDEVNAAETPAATAGTPADAPGFTDIMKTDAQQKQENIQRRQQRLASGRKGTILTGTRGTNNSTGNYQRKTLLGS